MGSSARGQLAGRIALVLAWLACLWSAGCATSTSPPDPETSSRDEDLGRLFEDLYRDVDERRVRNGECTIGRGGRWCWAQYDREDEFFGYESYAVITIEHSARTLVIATLYILILVMVDFLYLAIDPRLRTGGSGLGGDGG